MTGNEILARCLKDHRVEVIFFLMGGPMIDCENACLGQEIRMIDARHEQAAAMMATAYSRLRRRPSVCMACSGPGATNLVTGLRSWPSGGQARSPNGAWGRSKKPIRWRCSDRSRAGPIVAAMLGASPNSWRQLSVTHSGPALGRSTWTCRGTSSTATCPKIRYAGDRPPRSARGRRGSPIS